jgi:hypothetical protein
MNFPLDVIEHILTYGSSYYKENYKNRGGAFYKQLEECQKTAISNVYVPIEKRKIKNRYTSEFAYLYERRLSDKYILYVRDNCGMDFDYYEEVVLEDMYETGFCKIEQRLTSDDV